MSLPSGFSIEVSTQRPDRDTLLIPNSACTVSVLFGSDADIELLEDLYEPGPSLTLTVGAAFVRELMLRLVEAGRRFLVTVPSQATISGSFPAICDTPADVEDLLGLLSSQARKSGPHLHPVHAWGLLDRNRQEAWLVTEFARDPDDESLWRKLLDKGVMQLTIGEDSCELFVNCDDMDNTLAMVRKALKTVPFPVYWA